MNHPISTCLLRIAVLCLFVSPAAGQQWTRFRGPNGAGQSDATTIPPAWTTKDYKWRVKLPGIGYSSPVIWKTRVFVTCADEENATRIIRCLDASDGGPVWKRQFESTPYRKHQYNSFASATPAVDEQHVYMAWTTPEEYTLLALDQQKGRVVWRRNLGKYAARHGSGASPIVFGDTVIAPNDQNGGSFAIAVDRMTGQTRWRTDLPVNKGGYATPCIYRPKGGQPQLILAGSAFGLISLDPFKGGKNWEINVLDDRIVGSPIIASGLIIAGCGEGGRGTKMVAVRPGNSQNGFQAEVAYEFNGSLPYVCTPVAHGDLLFLWFDLGVVTCVDASSGKIHWRERIGDNFFGSPVRVVDRLYCISRKGEMVILAAADEFQLLGRISLEERSHSTPAVADGVMYLRTVSHLMALSAAPNKSS